MLPYSVRRDIAQKCYCTGGTVALEVRIINKGNTDSIRYIIIALELG